eukprot:CAMPEP_0179216236 /NCGR_PEP_ID=MMETSP0797-20121207/3271_1 /TAXON_ID=47934 /ORGANISM="Dinophysis acuminata, Strain DAEP01" /LENGTH=359 /DNA_ID=CAMNT_0020922381 /DNA_START=1 /DNA_END=1077 /DNA_ORIENTATION=-
MKAASDRAEDRLVNGKNVASYAKVRANSPVSKEGSLSPRMDAEGVETPTKSDLRELKSPPGADGARPYSILPSFTPRSEDSSSSWWQGPFAMTTVTSPRPAEEEGRLSTGIKGARQNLDSYWERAKQTCEVAREQLGCSAVSESGLKLGCAAVTAFLLFNFLGLSLLRASPEAGHSTPGIHGTFARLDTRPRPLVSLMPWPAAQAKASRVVAQLSREEQITLLHGTGVDQMVPGYYVGNTQPITRVGIPALKMQDASAGFRPTGPHEIGTTTCWPSQLALAATWDEVLVEHVAAAIALEFRQKGANVLLGPGGMSTGSPVAGNFEYLSGDDPYLGSRLAVAYVQGVQGQGVMAVAKHFA